MTEIHHEPSAHRFSTVVDGVEAYVEYERGDGVMTITHTIVPDPIGGRGIAGDLTRAAFDHARAEGLRVRPACSYAAGWAERHPEVSQLLA